VHAHDAHTHELCETPDNAEGVRKHLDLLEARNWFATVRAAAKSGTSSIQYRYRDLRALDCQVRKRASRHSRIETRWRNPMARSDLVYVTYIAYAEKLWSALTDVEFIKQYWFGLHCEAMWTAVPRGRCVPPWTDLDAARSSSERHGA